MKKYRHKFINLYGLSSWNLVKDLSLHEIKKKYIADHYQVNRIPCDPVDVLLSSCEKKQCSKQCYKKEYVDEDLPGYVKCKLKFIKNFSRYIR